jgi:hypothetical protein
VGRGGIGAKEARGGGIGAEDVRGGGIRVEDGGGGGIGAKNGGGNVDGQRGGEGGSEDGGGRGHEDGMVLMTLPLGRCANTRGNTWVCFIPLGFLVETSNLTPCTMQKRLNCF